MVNVSFLAGNVYGPQDGSVLRDNSKHPVWRTEDFSRAMGSFTTLGRSVEGGILSTEFFSL